MSEKMEDLLATNEKELLSLCSDMQEIKSQFIEVSSHFAAKWYDDTAKQYVMKHSEVSLNLPSHKFTELKNRIRSLVALSLEIAKKELSQPGIWWHEKPKLHTAASQYDQLGDEYVGNKYPEVIDRPVRILLGQLGLILEEFGFNIRTTAPPAPCNQEYWFQETGEGKTSAYFPHMLEWSKPMQEALKEYNKLYKEGLVKLQEIQRIKDEIKRKHIIDLWESNP